MRKNGEKKKNGLAQTHTAPYQSLQLCACGACNFPSQPTGRTNAANVLCDGVPSEKCRITDREGKVLVTEQTFGWFSFLLNLQIQEEKRMRFITQAA